MIEPETLHMLVYQHVVQLTLLDHSPRRAFKIAHLVAALAFDKAFTSAGLEAARATIDLADEAVPSAETDQTKPKTELKQSAARPVKRPGKVSS